MKAGAVSQPVHARLTGRRPHGRPGVTFSPAVPDGVTSKDLDGLGVLAVDNRLSMPSE